MKGKERDPVFFLYSMNRRTARYSPLQQILRLWSCRFYHQLIAKETSLFSGLLVGASHQRPGVSGVWHRPGAPRSLVTTSTRSRARHESGTGSVADTAVGLFMVTSKHRLGWGGQFGVINLGSKYPHSCILEWLTVLKTFLLYHKSTFC